MQTDPNENQINMSSKLSPANDGALATVSSEIPKILF